ncbi:MAG: discoidin domain-containing protein, partial [Armatimonadetes bacterium]|nr:discoidin domain-containing protein [Armatimonadota bacterium]
SEVEVLSGGKSAAAGCAYSLTAPTSTAKYADHSGRLTDGDYSRPGDGWSKSVGWDKGSPEVTVDLLKPQAVGIVRVHCLGGGNGAVYFPRFLTVSTSLDGQTWSDPVPTDGPPPEPGGQTLTTFLTARLPGSTARFVRLRTERKGWAMLDEVEVLAAPH